MALVIISTSFFGRTFDVRRASKSTMTKHSKFAKRLAEQWSPRTNVPVTVDGCNPKAINLVVDAILDQGEKLYIPVKGMPFDKAIAVLHTLHKLEVVPTQTHIEKYITCHLANEKILPSEIAAIENAFGMSRVPAKVCDTLAQALAWSFTHPEEGRYTAAEEAALWAEASKPKHFMLKGDIEVRTRELWQDKAEYEARQAWNKKKQEAREAKAVRDARKAEQQRKDDEAAQRYPDYQDELMAKAKKGEIVASESTIDWVKGYVGYGIKRTKTWAEVVQEKVEEEDENE